MEGAIAESVWEEKRKVTIMPERAIDRIGLTSRSVTFKWRRLTLIKRQILREELKSVLKKVTKT